MSGLMQPIDCSFYYSSIAPFLFLPNFQALLLKVVKLSKHNVLLFIFSPDKGFWYVPGEFAILQYGMWECAKVGNNAYFRLFKLAAGKLFYVPSCAFDTNDFFVFV